MASHKSNSLSVPRGIVDLCCTLPCVTCCMAAWHWGSDSSVINDTLGEPGRTLLYVGLPSVWGSVDGHIMFFAICGRAPF